ncbi:MAG: phosphatidylserine decarboxylase family protein [Planctomycetes bacterium]|nr:phosphatidylserine decarboxylase family protein [Planctomycetota bacterium]
MLASYARFETVAISIIGIGATYLCDRYLGWWSIAPALLTLALLAFYRDPPRRIPDDDNILLAPADGKIAEITRNYDVDGHSELRIVIFLSVLNVHLNRSPCSGVVRDVKYEPGLFLNALKPESTEKNERNTLTIEPDAPIPGPLIVRQITGALARRIVCTAKPGDRLKSGQRFGMIKLGSRTELRVAESPNWRVLVNVGDSVNAGTSILARLETA